MKIKEICAKLQVTYPGLYWLLEEHKKEIGNHAIKKENGRWQMDDEVVDILLRIQKRSKKVIVEKEPADPHAAETIRGMQLAIDQLREENEKLKLRVNQGLYLHDAMENVLQDYDLPPEVQRAIGVQLKYFVEHISEQAIKKELKRLKKSDLI